jgi:single-strand DNA-binding protein
MNDTHVTIAGWVGTDVTLTEVAGGHQVASFRVATTPRRLREGEWCDGPTMWVQVKAWRRLAAHVAASVHQGDPVVVQGRLMADVWEREDGVVVSQTELVASSVGHDLAHGTSAFTKAVGRERAEVRPLAGAAADGSVRTASGAEDAA